MKNLNRLATLFALLATGLASCASLYGASDSVRQESYGGRWGTDRVAAPMKTIGEITGVPTRGVPYPLPGNETWMSSFTITQTDWLLKDSDNFSEGGLASKGSLRGAKSERLQLVPFDIRWHNASFVDRSSNEHWSLLDQRAVLSRCWLVVETIDEKPVTERLLFAATIDDTNGDSLLDDRDASVALMADGDGRNMRRVTPEGTQLVTVRLYPERGVLGLDLRLDTDGNGRFNRDEPVHLYYLPLDAESPAAQAWDEPEFRSSLEALYL